MAEQQEVRVLTVRQPWAWAILHGGKDVENRTRNIAGGYRGPVAIHVAKAIVPNGDPAWSTAAKAGMETDQYDGDALHLGHIIGVVNLVDVHSASVIGGCGRMDNNCEEHPYGCRHHCSPWAMGPAPEGWYQHLVLADPRPLATPIPYRGALGLRKLPADVAAAVLAPTFPAIGNPVTRETSAGGEHRQPVLWEGTVTKHLRTKARVHWTLRNGQRASAVLDHYPHEITESETADA